MDAKDEVKLIGMLKRHEGFRATLYRCPTGHWTIGYGHNCDAHLDADFYAERTLTPEEGEALLRTDLQEVVRDCSKYIRSFFSLSGRIQAVLIDMTYNMGIGKLLGFKRMLDALVHCDLKGVAREMLASKWASQVEREGELLFMVLTDEWV